VEVEVQKSAIMMLASAGAGPIRVVAEACQRRPQSVQGGRWGWSRLPALIDNKLR